MKIERTETGERLIIQSDGGNLDVVIALMIPMGAMFLFSIIMGIVGGYLFIPFGLIGTLLLLADILKIWIATSRTIIMSREGCTVQFYHYRKYYQWGELAVKKYVKGSFQLEDFIQGFGQFYSEGIFFSKYSTTRFKWMKPYRYCVTIRPFSSFFVNFYPMGIWEGHGDHKSQMEEYTAHTGKLPLCTPMGVSRKQEVYPADKMEFLKYMRLWQVEIEGLSKMDTILYANEYEES